MSTRATGTFEVKMQPLAAGDETLPVTLDRMSLAKKFDGDLTATGEGEMLTAMAPVKGSAGYVAIERVTGSLHGRKGTFVFQHSGLMDRGAQSLSISVVPDSGTDELVGLRGKLAIRIEDGQHFYDFDYHFEA